MSWLEEPQDEAERLVREGLDRAKQRLGDQVTHRRVWANVAEAVTLPEQVSSRRWVWVSAAATVAAAVGLVAYVRYYRAPGPSADLVSITSGSQTAESETSEDPGPAPAAIANQGREEQGAPGESERGPGTVIRTQVGERIHVALGGGAVAELEENSAMTWDTQHRPTIQRGVARLAVPHQPPGWRFSVTAGPYVVTVVGTKFDVRVSGRTVGVEVSEGVVEVWRNSRATRLTAGDSWQGPLHPDEPATPSQVSPTGSASAGSPSAAPSAPTPMERPRPPVAPTPASATASPSKPSWTTSRSAPEVETPPQPADPAKTIEVLARTAQGTGPAAENAAYELARVTRYQLHRPRQAIVLWEKYRARFPTGLLRTETDLSILETLSQMGEVRAALAEADAFLARHPKSERRPDVERLVERLRAAQVASEAR